MLDRERTYLSYLQQHANDDPSRTWLVEVDAESLTFGETYELGLRWADALRSLGIGAGDCVATLFANCIDSQLAWIGSSWLRALDVPMSILLRGPTLAYNLNNCQAKVLVTGRDMLPRVAEVASELKFLKTVVVRGGVEEIGSGIAVVDCAGLLASAKPADVYSVPQLHEMACILYTSGTTGPSKGSLFPWGQVNANFLSQPIEHLDKTEAFYHTGASNHIGARVQPAAMAALGGRFVMRPSFKTDAFWRDIDKYSCTYTTLVGAMAHFLNSQPPSPEDSRHALRRVLMAPLLPNLEEFCRRFRVEVVTAYGMTEISGPIVLGRWVTSGNPASCGKAREGWPYYDIRIVDEHDREVPTGTVGELIVRTGVPWTLNAGYYNQPEATARAWRNGWFHTGDAMRRDEEGNFYFVDRIKDAMRVSGENVSSFEVEMIANSHAQVAESAAVAVPASTVEDDIKIFLVCKPGETVDPEEFIRFCAKRMPRYMVPRYVEMVDEFPKTPTLRVQKHLLRTRPPGKVWDRVAAGLDLKKL